MLSKKPYKGCRDFFPAQKRVQDYLFFKMVQTAESFGHEHYDGPMLEEVELYKAKSGEELINEQIYDFTDRGNRHVAIRPEMTPTLARMVAQVHKEAPRPLRWYSIPNLLRYERPQRGRLREHWQFNCDIFGAPGRSGEVEILQLAIALLNSYGANHAHFEILLNDRQVIEALFDKLLKIDQDKSYQLIKLIDRFKKLDQNAWQESIKKLDLTDAQLKVLDSYLALQDFNQLENFLKEHKLDELNLQMQELILPLKELGLEPYIKYDPTIARGLDYYTGMVFEIFDKNPENRRAICGGGAYANLLKIFNEPSLPGVGFGLGDVTLNDFLVTHKLLPEGVEKPHNHIYLACDEAASLVPLMKLAKALRAYNLKVITHLAPVKFNKVFALAEKFGASYVGLLGQRELQAQVIQLKNLQDRQQYELSIQQPELIAKQIRE